MNNEPALKYRANPTNQFILEMSQQAAIKLHFIVCVHNDQKTHEQQSIRTQ